MGTHWTALAGGVALCAPLLAGCSLPQRATVAQLQTRSAFDMECPAQEMRLYHLAQNTKGVWGCGKRLTYVEVCDSQFCAWQLDSPPPATVVYYLHAPVASTVVQPLPVARHRGSPHPTVPVATTDSDEPVDRLLDYRHELPPRKNVGTIDRGF